MSGRIFPNSISNYLSRSSVNFGLNGKTTFSMAAWFWVNGLQQQNIIVKRLGAGTDDTFGMYLNATNALNCVVQNVTLGQNPNWNSDLTSVVLGVRSWIRALFTLSVSAGTVADGKIYINGASVPVGLNGTYTSAFTMEEDSNNYVIGLSEDLGSAPMNGQIAWANAWDRKLTDPEAAQDYQRPNSVLSGLVTGCELNPDTDYSNLGGSMTLTGTLNPSPDGPVYAFNTRPRLPHAFVGML